MIKTRDPVHCLEYRKTRAAAQRTFKNSQKQHWKSFCSTINNNTKLNTVWGMLKNMSGTKSKQDIPTIREGNKAFITNVEKAEAFARNIAKNSSHLNFETAFLENKKTKKLETTPDPTHQSHAINDRFEIYKIQTAIRQCKSNSSPGKDEVCYEMLKHLPKSSIYVLQTMFNQIWEKGILPKSWNHSIVLPIRKQMKDPSLLDSYRPIALTNALCKINERLIATRLNWFMERNKLFNPNQSGFRKNRCLDQIVRLQSNIEDSLNHKLYTVGIFLDFSKAYTARRNGSGKVYKRLFEAVPESLPFGGNQHFS